MNNSDWFLDRKLVAILFWPKYRQKDLEWFNVETFKGRWYSMNSSNYEE